MKDALKTTAPVVAGVVVLFAILAGVLVAVGVFDNSASKNDVAIVAGMLTLLGGLIASSFTLVGLLLKHSIDRRTARLADETEHRLRLETSIKAVELLTLPDGSPAPPRPPGRRAVRARQRAARAARARAGAARRELARGSDPAVGRGLGHRPRAAF